METKTIRVPGATRWHEERTITLVKKWGIVHAKSRVKTGGNNYLYDTKEACLAGCKATKDNNPEYIFNTFFPEGVDAAPFWCYENGDVHSAEGEIPTYIHIRKDKKSGNYQWSIYEVRKEPIWLKEGGPDLEKLKAEVLDIFPRAIFELLS